MKLNADIKTEWLKRLRSGDYRQGVGRLLKEGRHCCLGVLCEIAVDAGLVTKADPDFEGVVGFSFGTNGFHSTALPPEPVAAWAFDTDVAAVVDTMFSLWGPDGSEQDGFEREPLYVLNDCGHTFAEIADVIEVNF